MSGDTRSIDGKILEDPRKRWAPGHPWLDFKLSDKLWSLGAIIALMLLIAIVGAT